MTRPDPKLINRRPMARGRRLAVASHSAAGQPAPLFDADDRLNVDQLYRIIASAESVVEGCGYAEGASGDETFLGTVVLSLHAGSAALATRLAAAIKTDERARRATNDRIFREVSRLLEAGTPAELSIESRARIEGPFVRLSADIEAPLSLRSVAGR